MRQISMLLAIAMLSGLAGCATTEPQPEPKTAEATSESLFCEWTVQCSTTGDEFEGAGTPGGALKQAMDACKAECAGGTCRTLEFTCY